jgi:transposase
VASSLPTESMRWRCGACGNLTRFDVIHQMRVREYWHVDLSGLATVESRETLDSAVEQVTCRWCGRNDAVELVERPDASLHSDARARTDAEGDVSGSGRP